MAYYLVRSLGSPSFEDTDWRAATNFAAAAAVQVASVVRHAGRQSPASL
jgi:hypothetical protein